MEDKVEIPAVNTEAKEKVTTAAKGPINEDFEESFARHLANAELVKSEYKRLHTEMVEILSTVHLEPLSKLQLENEKTQLNLDEALQEFKRKLNASLEVNLESSWERLNIANGIARLETLKERFKEYESHDWNVADMTPEERSLPLCIRYKQMSKRYLETQIAQQNKNLEELMVSNVEQRSFLNEIAKSRLILLETKERNLKEQKQLIPHIKHLIEELPDL